MYTDDWKVHAEVMSDGSSVGYSVVFQSSTVWISMDAVDEDSAERLAETLNDDSCYPPTVVVQEEESCKDTS